jgi:2-C-methyl-D-erythritol 4-phosphate cytidylyltransferase/2-C-methyl-D-erythritol 2,4-cyclodiphosphate synthase
MSVWGLIVAAGRGQRFGGALAKQFLPLGGRPLLGWSLAAFDACPAIAGLVLVVAEAERERAAAIAVAQGLRKPLVVCCGGEARGDSVRAGLAVLPADATLVAIHDAARPLVTPALIASVVAAAEARGAALPALAVRDTLHRSSEGGGLITIERSGLELAQTPQTFRVELVREAHAADSVFAQRPPGRAERNPAASATDDAQLVAARGHAVAVVAGDPANFKITYPVDLALAEAIVAGRRALAPGVVRGPRVGTGYDVHRLVAGRRLVLGGVEIPFAFGLDGHSDADVVAHAIGDALLGAAGLGDLGAHFPPDDPRYLGISSLELLRAIAERVAAAGFAIGNADAMLICERPRIAPHLPAMREAIGGALAVDPARVSVKATSNEGLGFVGREEGIAALASVALWPADG